MQDEVSEDNFEVQENIKLKNDIQKLVIERTKLEKTHNNKIEELKNLNTEIIKERDQLANELKTIKASGGNNNNSQVKSNELETGQSKIEQLEKENSELKSEITTHQAEKQEQLTQINNLKSNYDKLAKNIGADIGSIKVIQEKNYREASKNFKELKETVKYNQGYHNQGFHNQGFYNHGKYNKGKKGYYEEKKYQGYDNYSQKQIPQKQTRMEFNLGKEYDRKRMKTMSKEVGENLKEILLYNIPSVESDVFHSLVTSSVPRGLETIVLEFSSKSNYISGYLDTINNLEGIITKKISFDWVHIYDTEQSALESKFSRIEVKFDNVEIETREYYDDYD
ncbi:unnamed protein product [Moneuplotes crassus]|uniref:Uncharacterized protein n=1 Tax=Euplotes crassus TaxID=5936 RepID=A0AAD1U2K0_EUPCR|nr:unnamed protein product [Moneuplotes crassus]